MRKYCEDFRGGFCLRVEKNVPRSYCIKLCKGNDKKYHVSKLHEYPSMPNMVKSFTKGVAKHMASGMKKRTEEEFDKVMGICKVCEFYDIHGKIANIHTVRCRKCGCAMDVKARWASAHCLIGKW